MRKLILLLLCLAFVSGTSVQANKSTIPSSKANKVLNFEKRDMEVEISSSSTKPITGTIVVLGEEEESFSGYTVSAEQKIETVLFIDEYAKVIFVPDPGQDEATFTVFVSPHE